MRRIFETMIADDRARRVGGDAADPARHDEGRSRRDRDWAARPISTRLAPAAPAMPNVARLCRILHDLAVRRSLIRIGEDIVNTAYEAPTEKGPQGPDRGSGKGALCRRRKPRKYGEGAAGFP